MEINDLRETNVQQNSLTLLWLTGEIGNSYIPMHEYKIFQNSIEIDNISAHRHRYDVTGLKPGVSYDFLIKQTELSSTELENVVATSETLSVKTTV